MLWRLAAYVSVVMTKCHPHGLGTMKSTVRHDVRPVAHDISSMLSSSHLNCVLNLFTHLSATVLPLEAFSHVCSESDQ